MLPGPTTQALLARAPGAAAPPPVNEAASAAVAFPSAPAAAHGCRVDCVRVLPRGRLASKSADGRVIVWDTASGAKTQAASFRVPGCAAGDAARGRVGTTTDGDVLVAGSAAGDAYAYDTTTGAKLAMFSTGKARARACALRATLGHVQC